GPRAAAPVTSCLSEGTSMPELKNRDDVIDRHQSEVEKLQRSLTNAKARRDEVARGAVRADRSLSVGRAADVAARDVGLAELERRLTVARSALAHAIID